MPVVLGGCGVGGGGGVHPPPILGAQQDFHIEHAATATSACVGKLTLAGGGCAALVVATGDVRCTTTIAVAMGLGTLVALHSLTFSITVAAPAGVE